MTTIDYQLKRYYEAIYYRKLWLRYRDLSLRYGGLSKYPKPYETYYWIAQEYYKEFQKAVIDSKTEGEVL